MQVGINKITEAVQYDNDGDSYYKSLICRKVS